MDGCLQGAHGIHPAVNVQARIKRRDKAYGKLLYLYRSLVIVVRYSEITRKKMKMNITHITAAVLLPALVGCSQHHYGAALMKSDPAGAEVVDLSDDSLIGITPVKAWWDTGDDTRKFVNIRFQKDGYRDKTMSFWLNSRHGSREDAVAKPQLVETKLDRVGPSPAE